MIHSQAIVQRRHSGIQLVPPGTATTHGIRVEQLMALPMNFYFMNEASVMQKMNGSTACSNGYASANDGIGRSIRDISRQDTIHEILANDRRVVTTQNSYIAAEQFNRLDELELTAISIKFPWFQANQIRGILGCSILLSYENAPSLPEALMLLMQTGLLTPDNTPTFHGLKIDDIYIGERDKAILFLLVHGKTAKQIGRALQLSHRTIEHRLEAIKLKFSVSSKSELIERVISYLR